MAGKLWLGTEPPWSCATIVNVHLKDELDGLSSDELSDARCGELDNAVMRELPLFRSPAIRLRQRKRSY